MLCKKMDAVDGASTYSVHFGKAIIKELSLPPTNYKSYHTNHFGEKIETAEKRFFVEIYF